ncbi:MAG: hypothetical protein AUG75_13460 [Cyanobacteria bacterium 13_1_20CM_4_61_6]|nr:MAG: hypothetical protein AUG75_13460 [Cyanobacteria bacterium 13_1_20CM_4_61_6]
MIQQYHAGYARITMLIWLLAAFNEPGEALIEPGARPPATSRTVARAEDRRTIQARLFAAEG